MGASIDRVKVTGLHGRLEVDIPIIKNRIILVGFNGLGKTTIVNMLYFFLSQQWRRLSNFTFATIEIWVNGEPLSLERSDLVGQAKMRQALMKMASRGDAEGAFILLHEILSNLPDGDPEKRLIERAIRDVRAHSLSSGGEISPPRLNFVLQRLPILRSHRISKRVVEVSEKLEAAGFRVLYMPTYRRIEQELEEIFPGMSESMQEDIKSRIQERKGKSSGHVELVEFGMRDVDDSIARVTAKIRDSSRLEFSNLAGSYLRDVIRGEARSWERARVIGISEEQASAIVDRVEENTLSAEDRGKIIDAIRRAKSDANISDDDQLLAHFFWKLTRIFDTQKSLEAPIREFVSYCNNYLSGKRMFFDEVQLTVTCNSPAGGQIELRHLSSGEKQIVSLFAKLILDAEKPWWIIIDEPELSLSVAWQKKLLPDILGTGKCDFIAAVTHSPFIFDNELEHSTHDLSTLTTASSH